VLNWPLRVTPSWWISTTASHYL